MTEQGWDRHAVHQRKLHERYILFILLSVLVGVLTVKWSDVPRLTEYLSFALTLASLLLAVMAIGYAIYSNHGLETNLVSLVSSIGEVKEIASSLSNSSLTLSNDIQGLSERTGGMDLRLTQIAENTRAQEQSKVAVKEQALTGLSDNITPPAQALSGFDLKGFADVTSMSGRLALFALTIACLNKRKLNMRQLFRDDEYMHGFVVALSSANVFEGDSLFNAVEVENFPGADVDFLALLVNLNQAAAARSDVASMPESMVQDLGRMRTYFEDNGFDLFGSLDGFRRLRRRRKSAEAVAPEPEPSTDTTEG